jgi:hypothetical protein
MPRMQLRFKLTAIASAMVVAAGMGIAGIALAGPAAASNNVVFCVLHLPNTTLCAASQDDHGSDVTLSRCGCQAWDVPATSGEISAVGDSPSECMQVGPKDFVIEESCSGHSSEEWTASKAQTKGKMLFKNKSDNLCLYGQYSGFTVKVAGCNSSNLAEEWAQTGD